MNKKNPIIEEFKKFNLLNPKNFKTINNKTRDKKCKVFQDVKTGIIVLEKNYNTSKSYSNSSYYKINNKKKIIGLNIYPKDYEEKRRYELFKKFINNKKVCDFGCNFGKFLKLIKSKAKNVCGVEINKQAYNYLKNKFIIKKNILNFKTKFNTITMFHTLEHLTDHVLTLKSINTKLLKNGKIIVEVPHANDFLIKFGPKKFKDFTFWSQHLVLYTKESLIKVLKLSGFKKISVYGYQRYNLHNHYYWMKNKKPGGHKILKNKFDKNLIKSYEVFLNKHNYNDTLIAVASK